MSEKMLRIEYDVQHHLLLSRKNLRDHALIRMIISTLCTPEELLNITKKDFRIYRGKNYSFHVVQLRGKLVRNSPVDKKTYQIVSSLGDKPFDMKMEEIDETVRRYSPSDNIYDAKKLRNAVVTLLKDSSLFEIDFEALKELEDLYMFMLDFNPIYSDVWDIEDEEGLEEFLLNIAEIEGPDSKKISEKLGLDEEKVSKILSSGKKSLFSFLKRL